MDKIEVIAKLKKEKLVAVIRTQDRNECEKIADAIIKGGINFIEITMTVPGAIEIIKFLAEKYRYNKEVIVGAGTVLDAETARMAILAGAKYIVSPALNEETIKICNRYRVLVMPGIMTATEIVQALEMGVDIIKMFPSSFLGTNTLKAFKEPFPQANFMPTGHFNIEEVEQWLEVGAIAVGVANTLTHGAKTGNYELITKNAIGFVNTVRGYEKKRKGE